MLMMSSLGEIVFLSAMLWVMAGLAKLAYGGPQ
jgi:hypothetical protein